MKVIFLILVIFLTSLSHAHTILFLGDSLTEGYQLPKEDAYPAVIEKELKKTRPEIKIINGGVSGATSASGLKRLDWYLKASPDFMILALGANDGLRGLKLQSTEKNLADVIEKAQQRKIVVILAGMKMPTNYGEPYRSDFEKMFPKVAKKYDVKLIPFLLEGVGGIPKYNLSDGIHPNPEGHKIMAKTILKVLEPLL
jgi:acyl-CoA thioesterase-1